MAKKSKIAKNDQRAVIVAKPAGVSFGTKRSWFESRHADSRYYR